MARLSIHFLLLTLLVLPCMIQILDIGKNFGNLKLKVLIPSYLIVCYFKIYFKITLNFPGQGRSSLFVRAQEDEAEGEEGDEGAVEDEEGGSDVENEEDAAVDEEETNKNVHKDADTQLLFTKPSIISGFESGSVELPAGKVSKLLIY